MGCSASNVRTIEKSNDDRILYKSSKSSIVIVGEATERVDQTDLIQKQEMIGKEMNKSKGNSKNKENSINGDNINKNCNE